MKSMKKNKPCATQKISPPTPGNHSDSNPLEDNENSARSAVISSTRYGRKILLAMIMILALCWSWQKIRNPATFPIRSVKIIDHSQHVSHTDLQAQIMPFLKGGMLWLNMTQLTQTLQNIPWVDEVAIRRGWPDELIIQLTEQQPLAHWNQTSLFSSKGEIFAGDSNNAALPLPWLNGPDGQQMSVWQGYQLMQQMLAPLGLHIAAVNLSPRNAWQILLNNGMLLILGRDNVPERLKRFVEIYPQVFANNLHKTAYIDLRYDNGFAVKWANSEAAA